MADDMTRRAFTERAIGSLLTFSLLDVLADRDLFAAPVRPLMRHWLADLDTLGREVKDQELKQTEWQKKVVELMGKVDVPDFLKLIDFAKLEKQFENFDRPGPRSFRPNFPKVDGIPTDFVFGRQIFACKKDRAIVPHGHNNMATAFLILKGRFRGRLYDRVKDEPGIMVIKPTIDDTFAVGGVSTISDEKDNVHWFTALEENSYIFNIHVLGVTPGKRGAGRVYVDPAGEKTDGGLIRGRRIDHDEATKLYG